MQEDIVSQKVAVDKSEHKLEEHRNREWGLSGADSGIHAINMKLGGLMPKKVLTIAGRSGMGKTSIVTPMIIASMRATKIRPEFCFFTWEMPPEEIVDRLVCNEIGMTGKMLTQGAKLLGSNAMSNIKASYKKMRSVPILYQDVSTNIGRVSDVFERFAKKVREKEASDGIVRLPVLIIDYIGIAQLEGAGPTTYAIRDFMKGCKDLVKRVGGQAIVLAQVNRGSDEKDLPTIADLSDSSFIEQNSDAILVIHRPEYRGVKTITDPESGEDVSSSGKMLLRFMKNRGGGTGDVLINCDVKYNRFWDQHHTFDFPYWKCYEKKEFWMKEFGFTRT